MAPGGAGAGDAGGAGERPRGLRAPPPRQRRRHEQVPHHRQARAALQQREQQWHARLVLNLGHVGNSPGDPIDTVNLLLPVCCSKHCVCSMHQNSLCHTTLVRPNLPTLFASQLLSIELFSMCPKFDSRQACQCTIPIPSLKVSSPDFPIFSFILPSSTDMPE